MSFSDDNREARLAMEKAEREARFKREKERRGATYINPRRLEEAKRTQNHLPAPAQIQRPVRRRDITQDDTPGAAAEITHPWKVTSNGDNTVSVGYGSLYSYDEVSLTLREYEYYDGTGLPITVTGAGSIYGSITSAAAMVPDINYSGVDSNGDTYGMELLRIFPDTTADVAFSFETTPPTSGSAFYFEIAKVDLVDGVATVTRQILTHNPTLASWLEPP